LLHIHSYSWINTSKPQWLKYVCTISSNTQKFYVLPTKCIYVFFYISAYKQRLLVDFSILRKNPNNTLIYVNTTLFSLSHCCMFQPFKGHPQGVLTHFLCRVNTICVQM